MRTKTIRQRAAFKADPREIYEVLMDSKKHSRFTESEARISRKVGGKVSAYDGWVEAYNLELVPNKKIVQKWRGADWPKGHYSIAKFVLKKTKTGTTLAFTQTSVPIDVYDDIKDGWKEHYWEKMKRMLES